jgi:hypothetical protein
MGRDSQNRYTSRVKIWAAKSRGLHKATVTDVKDLGGLQIQRCIAVDQYLVCEAWKILLVAAELHKFVMSP